MRFRSSFNVFVHDIKTYDMKSFILSLLKDVQGNISSKRIAFLVILVLFVTIALEVSFGKMKFVPEIWDGVKQTLWFLGGYVASEYLPKIGK